MQFGVCTDPTQAATLARAGYDFIELNVQVHLRPLADDAAAAADLARIRASALPARAANCFIPANMPIVGPAVDGEGLRRYAATALRRAAATGIRTIVFGSGGARAIPEGFDRAAAWQQLVAFGRMAAEAAAPHDVTIAVEPLNRTRKECNVLNGVGECARLVKEIDCPALRLLVDSYHWSLDNDSAEDLVAAGPLLRHVHVSTTVNRLAPGLEPCDHAAFFRLLREAGYDGPVSIEGKWNDLTAEAPRALDVLRQAARA
jgi:sugar phosphate isomerase/epimerase